MVDPMRRQILALSPIIGSQGFAPNVFAPAVGAGASPIQAVSRDATSSSGVINQVARDGAAGILDNGRQPIKNMLVKDVRDAAPAGAALPLADGAEKPGIYDERHAPAPETLGEATRDIKVTSKVFSPKQSPAPTPFAYSRDYRTTTEQRRWLTAVEAKLGDGPPYPSGSPGPSGYSSGDRARMRILTGYLYTLPEVKAFLDAISTTEGSKADGYFTTSFGRSPATSLKQYAGHAARGRYQIEPGVNGEIVTAQMGRSDFGEVTQDMAAIALLVRKGAIQKLMAGDLRGAFSAAARVYASLPMSQVEEYSGFTKGDPKKGITARWVGEEYTPDKRQPHFPYADLPALYLARLNSRRTEFREAQRNWEQNGQMPWAFISPYRQGYFGRDAFKLSR
jgi:muramidase (phage lysozyme)